MTISGNALGDELLRVRERKALIVSMRARAGFALVGVVAIWIVAGELIEKLASSLLFVPMVVLSFWLSKALSDSERLRGIGFAGVLMDSVTLCGLPVVWHLVYTSPERPLVHLVGHQLGLVAFILIILNGAALRPLLPALMTGVSVSLHIFLALLAVTDARLASYPGGLDSAVGIREGVGDLFLKPLLIALGGSLLVWITAGARRMLEEVVEREQREQRMQQEQMQMVLQAQVSALGQLVAGVEHEVNSPLGAVRSSADTASKAVATLRQALASEEPSKRAALAERAVRALEDSVSLTVTAGERLSEVMSTISRFVHSDRAQRQPVDLGSSVADATRAVEQQFNESVTFEVGLEEGLVVEGDGPRLAQAFSTVIKNAAQAVDAGGTVRVSMAAESAWLTVDVTDDGRGMDAQDVSQLFDIDFASSRRVRARFGLAACRSVIHGHGGEIEIQSALGEGTRVRMRLPRRVTVG